MPRARPGEKALREIRALQQSTELLFRRIPFARLVREIMQDHLGAEGMMRIQSQALVALQEMTEWYMVHLMEHSGLATIHRGRQTLEPRDIHLARRIRGRDTA